MLVTHKGLKVLPLLSTCTSSSMPVEYDIENAGSTSSSRALGKETSASQESEDNKKGNEYCIFLIYDPN